MKHIFKGMFLPLVMTILVIVLLATNAQARVPGDGNTLYLPVVLDNYQAPPPTFSPINKIVYSSGYTDADRRYDIYVMNPDGTGQTRLTYGSASSNLTPTWSPDGAEIAFTSITQTGGDDTINQIFIMNADGTGMTKLFNNPGHHYHPTWSPYGTQIAFTSDLHNPGAYTPNEIYVVNADGSGSPINLTNSSGTHDDQPSWSPDGTKIAFVSWVGNNAEIFVMNSDGSGQTNLTNSVYNDYAPSWSPDSQKVAFFRRLGSTDNWSRQIYIMNADGVGQTQLTNNSGQNWYPNWSPDGTQIAFQTYYYAYADIYVMNANGTGVTNITNHQNSYASIQPDWR